MICADQQGVLRGPTPPASFSKWDGNMMKSALPVLLAVRLVSDIHGTCRAKSSGFRIIPISWTGTLDYKDRRHVVNR
jgi:hypothetical protein